jgi:integrase
MATAPRSRPTSGRPSGTSSCRRSTPELLETFYARLRRCREQCGGRPRARHECKPLSASSVRQMHFILRGALGLGVRWKWVSVNAAADARPPSLTPPDPTPPTPKQAAVLLTRAWEKDPDSGCLLWVAMTTGARRAQLRLRVR